MVLSDSPVELDPGYSAPDVPIEEAIQPRQPRVGEWVNCFDTVPNGPGDYRRGQTLFLARVIEVRQGDYTHGGCLVRPWSRASQSFGEAFFTAWCSIISRTQVNRYALLGEAA